MPVQISSLQFVSVFVEPPSFEGSVSAIWRLFLIGFADNFCQFACRKESFPDVAFGDASAHRFIFGDHYGIDGLRAVFELATFYLVPTLFRMI